jgi:hypothetical protein
MPQQVVGAYVEASPGAHAPKPGDRMVGSRVIRIAKLSVRRPLLRDLGDGASSQRMRFTSKALSPFTRRTKNVEEPLPPPAPPGAVSFGDRRPPGGSWLYLKGASTGHFAKAATALLGPEALSRPRPSAAPSRSPDRGSFGHGSAGLLAADGGAGHRELPVLQDGYRESTQSRRALLLRLRVENGLGVPPGLTHRRRRLGFLEGACTRSGRRPAPQRCIRGLLAVSLPGVG